MDWKERLKYAWNIFRNRDPTARDQGPSFYYRPDRARFSSGKERTIVAPIFNRIANDVSAITMQHVRLDDKGRFASVIPSGLNRCLNVEANIDQSGRAFLQDAVQSMLDEGCIAMVPTDIDTDPTVHTKFEIFSMRVSKIIAWHPDSIRVEVYNEQTGHHEALTVKKCMCAIVENPFFSVMNEPNSTLQRLNRKLALLDAVDEQSSAGKLNMIIQLPYLIRSDARRQQAEERRRAIEEQLSGTKYGIAYADGTEKVIQLNRPVENNLMSQIEYLTSMLYSQLGLTQGVMDGTADDKTMLNYYNRTVEPILSAIADSLYRSFLTKAAQDNGEAIKFFRDPFRLVPVNDLAEIADKFTRNEIASANEFRQVLGWKPSNDPRADMLLNKNISQSDAALQNAKVSGERGATEHKETIQNEGDLGLRRMGDEEQRPLH